MLKTKQADVPTKITPWGQLVPNVACEMSTLNTPRTHPISIKRTMRQIWVQRRFLNSCEQEAVDLKQFMPRLILPAGTTTHMRVSNGRTERMRERMRE